MHRFRQMIKQIALKQGDSIAHAMAMAIAPGYLQGSAGDIKGIDFHVGQVYCYGDGDGPAAGANIGNQAGVSKDAGCQLNRLLHQEFGFRSRYEGRAGNLKIQPIELFVPGDIGSGFVAYAALDKS